MGEVKWLGVNSTDSGTPTNWSTGALPVTNDDVIFDATSDGNNHCILEAGTFPKDGGDLNSITIRSDFTKQIQTAGACEINLEGIITINKPACIKNSHALTFDFNAAPSTTVYDGNGSSYTHKPFVVFSSGMTSSVFENTGARVNTTFDFGNQTFTMIDGVYPNVTFTGTLYTKSVYSDASRTLHNTYGSVNILALNANNVKSENQNIYDYDKEFSFEGALTAIGEYFKFGHTTARFKATNTARVFPVSGELNSAGYGNDSTNNFYAQYEKVVIDYPDSSTYYWKINAGKTLECNELVINDGGRLYGPATETMASTIKSVKRPTIHGDWNFRQVADGVYDSINDFSNTSVFEGGTGRQTLTKNSILYGQGMDQVGLLGIGSANQLLKVNSGATGLEWGAGPDFVIFGEEADLYAGNGSTGNANGYQFSYGNGRVNVDQSSSGADFGIVIPFACTLTRVDVVFGNSGNIGSGTTTFVVVKNGTNQSGNLSTTHSSGIFDNHHTGLSHSFAAGDRFNLRTTTGSQQVGPMRMTATFTRTD